MSWHVAPAPTPKAAHPAYVVMGFAATLLHNFLARSQGFTESFHFLSVLLTDSGRCAHSGHSASTSLVFELCSIVAWTIGTPMASPVAEALAQATARATIASLAIGSR